MAAGHKQDPVFPVKFIMSQKKLTCLHDLLQIMKMKHHKTFAVIISIKDNIKGYYHSILVPKGNIDVDKRHLLEKLIHGVF